MRLPACLFAAALMWAVVLAVTGCDDEQDAAPNCAAWLACYDACGPWEQFDLVRECDANCRAELDYDAGRVAEPFDPETTLALPTNARIVAAELAAIDARAADDRREEAAELAASLQERGRCIRSPREPQ